MCQTWLQSDGRVEKKGGKNTHTDRQTDRQTDKGMLELYIVDKNTGEHSIISGEK